MRPITPTTRLAPSPTGALHLGNARTFLITWALARKLNWRIALRVEDLDGPRVKPDAARAILDTFRWLGIDWDTTPAPITQSDDLAPYLDAMQALAARARVFPSAHTRQELEAHASPAGLAAPDASAAPNLPADAADLGDEALSAPHPPPPAHPAHPAPSPSAAAGREVPFPESLRPAEFPSTFTDLGCNWRFLTPAGTPTDRLVHFVDRVAGPCTFDVHALVGDFIVWTKRAAPAYQLAVVVDDLRQGVTDIVRGDDLLDSAARQLLIRRALAPHAQPPLEPTHWHLPLVLGPDGLRLAKRHGDTRVDAYRALGTPAERVIGLIAFWSGLSSRREPMSARDFLDAFDPTLRTLPRTPVTCTPEDDRWLRSST
jgi:glutamyl-tRNA synthetase